MDLNVFKKGKDPEWNERGIGYVLGCGLTRMSRTKKPIQYESYFI